MAKSCDRCGAEPEAGKAFPQTRKAFRVKGKPLCPSCTQKRQKAEQCWIFFWVALWTVAIVMGLPGNRDVLLERVLFHLVFAVALLSPLSVMIHELAHALAGKLCGFRVFSVEFGWQGKSLIHTRIGETRWILRWFPSGGICRLAPRSRDGLRLKTFIVVAAGPLSNLFILALVACHVSWDTLWSVTPLFAGFHPWYLLFWVNVSLLYRALFPKRHTSPLNPGLSSDGLQMWLLLKNDPTLLEETHKAYYVMQVAYEMEQKRIAEAEALLAEGQRLYPDDVLLQVVKGSLDYQKGELPKAIEGLQGALKNLDDQSPYAHLLRNNLAYFIAVVGDPARLSEAETLSREALAACPGVGAFLGTRGAVLVRLTKNEEGLEFLWKSLKDSPDSESQGENLTWMALAHFQLGQREKAGELLRRASKHGPTFPVFEEVSKLLAPSPCRV
jgi:Tfp pilus assembly protein PilF